MPTNILMPALSPTMEKGNLARWLKKEGDKIKPGDVIAEIETDKATMEYEAVDEGTLSKIVVPEGTQDVAVNAVIAVMTAEGEDVKAVAVGAAKTVPASKVLEKLAAPSFMTPAAPALQDEGKRASAPKPAPRPEEGAKAPVSKDAGPRNSTSNRIVSSPLARRLAKDAGVDLNRVQGSGPHGRVIARDIDAAASGQGLRETGASPTMAFMPMTETPFDAQIRALYEDGSYELVPHDGMRRTIAQRLTASTQTVPHFYVTVDCNIGRLMAAREEINAAAPKDQDGQPAYKISVNDFVIKALALALQRVPDANVSWTEAGMLKHKRSDIGVAVALPGGLITPIVRAAETKSLSIISNEMRELAVRARARKLKPQEYQGGSSSVSNLGMYGIKDFTAVINPPQSTILAVGTGEERAVVIGGKLEPATIMSVTLSCDHRAVDGALGAQLIGAFKMLIESPVMMVV
ncbi:MAG: pyruvate dehydrogenase complex dihydrolipoamide acetyltransferase [Pseudolabrys sp.]|nr:pyruvate dehydrogenase complex dihydrolipoamide acetyltransferase [Pseudolabrys sp.]